jgi:multiple sugar transport system substrate-binding protein
MRTFLFVTCLLPFSGCSGSDDSANGGDVVTLTYWSAQNEHERRLAIELAGEWNRAHPDVQVVVQPLPAGQSSEEVLLAAIVAGTTPDICSNIWPGIVNGFVRAGGVLALDQFADFDSLMNSRVPERLRTHFQSADGHYYQIPWKTNPTMMLYNRGLLEAAGISKPPSTYSEYLQAAEKMSGDLDGDGQFDRWMGYRDIRPIWWQRYFDFYAFYIGASGGKTFFDHGEIALDTTAASTVFAFFRELYANHYFPLTTYQGSAFLAEKIVTDFTGPYNIGWMEENAPPDMDFHYAPLPAPDDHEGPLYVYGDFKNIAIFSNTEHPEEAWAFAQFLVTRQADLRLLELTRQIPIRKGLLSDSLYADFFARNPRVVPFAEQAPYTRGVDAVPSFQEILDAVAQQYEAAAVYGVRSPSDAATAAIDRIRLIHEWSH